MFANDNGSYRTYYGTRVIFDRFKRRNGLSKYHIHYHGLRHTFSNMLFEMNEKPKVIQYILQISRYYLLNMRNLLNNILLI